MLVMARMLDRHVFSDANERSSHSSHIMEAAATSSLSQAVAFPYRGWAAEEEYVHYVSPGVKQRSANYPLRTEGVGGCSAGSGSREVGAMRQRGNAGV